jgi:putative protease
MTEVILGHIDFSRFGKLSNDDFKNLANRSKELNLRVILEWDILMTEDKFHQLQNKIFDLLPHAEALRVQDPGAFEWCLKNTNHPLQFVAENGNHNIRALEAWIEHAQGRLERIVLSLELPKNKIQEYCEQLKSPCELLGLGRILLFYTPRQLLAPLQDDKVSYNDELVAIGESEESPHKGFPIIENRHGTFMFHIKEFCVLEYAQELEDYGLSSLRLDLRWTDFSVIDLIMSYMKKEINFEELKNTYPQDLMKGFYLTNKTDVLFPKLKNHRLQNRQGDYVGEVIEAEKGSHIAIHIKNERGLKKSDRLRIIHPKGDEFFINIYSLRNLALEDVEIVSNDSVAIIQFAGGVWVKSHVFYA